MENGLKVASSDLPSPSATIGLYVEAGSAFDEIPGTAHLIQHMAFKSSSSVSQLKMTTVLESLGAATSSLSSRENIVFQIDTLKSSVPQLVGLLAETSLAPKFHSWEVEEAHAAVKAELQELQQNPQALLQEMSHAAAYGRGSPLGRVLRSRAGPAPDHGDRVGASVAARGARRRATGGVRGACRRRRCGP